MTGTEAMEIIRVCINPSKHCDIDDAWETLNSIVLAQQATNKQNIRLPKEAVKNITECISNQQDIPVEFKDVLVNNFRDLS